MKRLNLKGWHPWFLIFGIAAHVHGSSFDHWMYRSEIQFTGYTGSETLTNFPALVILDGETIANFRYSDFLSGDNADLRFTAADGTTELDYEVEHWDSDGTSYVWVRVPELVDTNTAIYAYWGRGGQDAPASTTNGAVWGQTHLGVWHLNSDEQDTTHRENHGVNYGTTAEDGIVAGGRAFDGSAHIELPANLRNLGATNRFAITFWFKAASASSSMQCLMEDGTSWTSDAIYLFVNPGANQILAHLRNDSGGSVQLDTINVPTVGTNWHSMAHVYDGAVVRTYFDGEQVWSANISGNINNGNTPLQIGRRPPGSYYFNGVMDELRIERVSRPADWIRACWMNQGSNEVFQTYGAAELQSGRPEIENRTPVVLDATTAVLNGYLVSTGTAATAVSVYWGAVDGGEPDSGLWPEKKTWTAGDWESGTYPALTVSNLTAGTFYYYRYAAGNANGDHWASESRHFLAGDVWVTGGTAYEEGEIPGDFTFHRAASATGEATVVYFTIGGTATPGDDYMAITQDTVTIPAGASTATLTVQPVYDLFDEPDETVELTLLPGLYAVGDPSSAVVKIVDANAPPETNWSVISASSNWHDSASWSLERVPIPGEDVIVTNSLYLKEPSVLLKSFTIQGGTLTFTNWTTRLRAVEVDLQGGALSHVPQSAVSADEFGEWIPDARVWIVCSNLTVAADATINVEHRGYSRGAGDGSSTATFGGSHGGRGAASESGWGRPDPYGSLLHPTDPGSGGWSTIGGAGPISGDGGGAIRIDATSHVEIHGTLSADGQNGGGVHASGGSGGSIFINCRTFSGSGTGLLTVRGGSGGTGASRGSVAGGGRIAVVYDAMAQAQEAPGNPGVRFRANNGSNGRYPYTAEVGTVYLPDTAFLTSPMHAAQWQGARVYVGNLTEHWEVSELQIDGQVAFPQLETLRVNDHLRIGDGGRLTLISHPTHTVDGEIGFRLDVGGTLTVENNARLVLFCDPETGGSPYIECGNLNLQTGGLIDADWRGFGAMLGPSSSTAEREGGGHGGASALPGPVPTSGVAHAPILAGSGGGDAVAGGSGGGSVRIAARSRMILDGTISANGHERVSIHRGGGAGGGILLSARDFEGSGTLRANGGNSSHWGRAGGGGRIALWRPFLPPSYFREIATRPLAGHITLLDPEQKYPDLIVTVDPGTGGHEEELAEEGTRFFGFLQSGMLLKIR